MEPRLLLTSVRLPGFPVLWYSGPRARARSSTEERNGYSLAGMLLVDVGTDLYRSWPPGCAALRGFCCDFAWKSRGFPSDSSRTSRRRPSFALFSPRAKAPKKTSRLRAKASQKKALWAWRDVFQNALLISAHLVFCHCSSDTCDTCASMLPDIR